VKSLISQLSVATFPTAEDEYKYENPFLSFHIKTFNAYAIWAYERYNEQV
jgi:hypothetical protein